MTIISVSTVSRNPAVAGDGLLLPASTAKAAPYGAAGPLIAGTSKTTNTIDTISTKVFTIEEFNRSFYPGTRVRATAVGYEQVWLEGIVTAWDGENISIDGDQASDSGTYSDWQINVAGEPGAIGPIGPQGPIGPSGGPIGPQGPPGTPGSVWRNGNGPPLNSLGTDGDYYLNDLTDDVYLRSASVYTITANIHGNTGAQGPTGATGPQGLIAEPPNDGLIYSRRQASGVGAWVQPPGGGDVQHTITLTAGAGLTGGGDLSANRTFTVGAGAGITVNADDVALTVPVAIASGGTGATSAAAALTALGAAPIAAPVFTGDARAVTPAAADNDTSIATTAFTAARSIRNDIAQTLTPAEKSQARANIDVLKKNYIINGAMRISQENGATAVNPVAALVYPVDMFIVNAATSGTCTVAQVASLTPGGSPNRMRFTVTAADAAVAAGDLVQIIHRIEGLNVADLKIGTAAAKQVTLQFGVKAPAGTYGVCFVNGATNRSYVAEYIISAGEANTDVVKFVTLTLDTTGTWISDNGIGTDIRFLLMGGSSVQTATPNTWISGFFACTASQFNFMGTNGNVFELFDVGLYEGAIAPAFQVPDYASALAMCQRYYWREANPSWLWMDGISLGSGANLISFPIKLPCTMRAIPTVTLPTFSSIGAAAPTTTIAPPSNSMITLTAVSNAAANTRIQISVTSGSFVANARL